MVIAAGKAEEDERYEKEQHPTTTEKDNFMAMIPERSRGSLPNFSSLPCFNIKWGRQKQLRCVKYSDQDFPTSSSSYHRRSGLTRYHPTEFNSGLKRRSSDDGGIEAMREKLMLDFRAEVHQMQAAFLKKSDVHSMVPSPALEARPWNLRTRRAVCKEPNSLPATVDRNPNLSPARQSEVKSPAGRNGFEVDGSDDGAGPRAKFSVSLSKQEIEEDFIAIMGNRPARRPKKRPKYVQKQIDASFPGFWLSEITADMYKVNEQP